MMILIRKVQTSEERANMKVDRDECVQRSSRFLWGWKYKTPLQTQTTLPLTIKIMQLRGPQIRLEPVLQGCVLYLTSGGTCFNKILSEVIFKDDKPCWS